ncbi:MAG: hypothetical protein R3C97_08725 [Geminicoccaceae bacterium]
MYTFAREVLIEWGDCDPAGIVFYPRYFAMFNQSTSLLFEAATGLTAFEIMEKYRSIGWPMVDTRALFHPLALRRTDPHRDASHRTSPLQLRYRTSRDEER